jgi:hypothetical protein
MGYRSDVKLAVYAKDQQHFKGCVAHWLLTGHLPFHKDNGGEGSLWDEVKVLSAHNRWYQAFGLLFETASVKWYQGYPEIDCVEDMINELEESGFDYEFVRVGENQEEDVEIRTSNNAQHVLRVYVEISLDDDATTLSSHDLEEIDICTADCVTNQSTIADRRSDTQPA